MINIKFYNLFKLISIGFILSNAFAFEANSSQSLLEGLETSKNITLTNDITLNHPIHLLSGQSINGGNHKITIDSADTGCQITLGNNSSITLTNFIIKNNNTQLICGSSISQISITYNNFESNGLGATIIALDNVSNSNIINNTFFENGSGSSIQLSNSKTIVVQQNFIQQVSNDVAVILSNSSSISFISNTLSLASGSPNPQIGVIVNGGDSISLSSNKLFAYSQQVDVVRLITGSNITVALNNFYLFTTNPYIAIGIYFGNNDEARFNLTNITIAQNNFNYFTTSNYVYLAALNFSATSTTSINTESSNDNIIGPGKIYGGVELGAQITGSVQFIDGTSYPTQTN